MQSFLKLLLQYCFTLRHAAWFIALWLLCLWGIHLINHCTKHRLNIFGIRPRTLDGFLSIPFAHFIHADFDHLFFNSFPLFVLATLLAAQGKHYFYQITISIALLSGFGIWLFARRGIHLGASALIMGYFGYIFTSAYFLPNLNSLIAAIIAFYYFGSLFFSIFPNAQSNVSWDGHLIGLLSGIITRIYLLPIILKF